MPKKKQKLKLSIPAEDILKAISDACESYDRCSYCPFMYIDETIYNTKISRCGVSKVAESNVVEKIKGGLIDIYG